MVITLAGSRLLQNLSIDGDTLNPSVKIAKEGARLKLFWMKDMLLVACRTENCCAESRVQIATKVSIRRDTQIPFRLLEFEISSLMQLFAICQKIAKPSLGLLSHEGGELMSPVRVYYIFQLHALIVEPPCVLIKCFLQPR